MFMSGFEFDIINPDAQRLITAFQSTDVDTIDFDSEVIEDSPENYSWIYRTKEEEEGFPVHDVKTGEMTGVNSKYNSVLVATFEQYEDPQEKIAFLEKQVKEIESLKVQSTMNGIKIVELEAKIKQRDEIASSDK
jgi:hypothetical protein